MPDITTKIAALFLFFACHTVSGAANAQSLQFRFGDAQFKFGDDADNREGKRATCEVYAKIAVIQAEANRKYRCGYTDAGWTDRVEDHFRWCRFVRRDSTFRALKSRAEALQKCFNGIGDFDDDRWERR